MPTSRDNKNQGWMKTYQTLHNNNQDLWIKKFEKKFSRVYVVIHPGVILFQWVNGFFVSNKMIEKLVFAVKNILNYLNKKKINRLGLNTQLFCRIERDIQDQK